MAFKNMLDQMLSAGRDLASQGQSLAEKHLNVPAQGPERDAALSNLGKGALAGGALAVLLGTGAGRKLAGTAAALGGIGALGKVAYDAYNNWQSQQSQAAASAGVPVGELQGDAAEQRSRALFRAMVAAANADGHIDAAELAAIEQGLGQLGLDAATRELIEAELSRPLDAVAVASAADSPETAAELYLASLFVIDVDHPQERAYLDRLAAELQIQPTLAAELERRAQVG
jgi:uncharacterized membrane protein YebE (DUF533 family)